MYDLRGKTAVVTGAAMGMGRSLALLLVRGTDRPRRSFLRFYVSLSISLSYSLPIHPSIHISYINTYAHIHTHTLIHTHNRGCDLLGTLRSGYEGSERRKRGMHGVE